jgi:hypothetical protein
MDLASSVVAQSRDTLWPFVRHTTQAQNAMVRDAVSAYERARAPLVHSKFSIPLFERLQLADQVLLCACHVEAVNTAVSEQARVQMLRQPHPVHATARVDLNAWMEQISTTEAEPGNVTQSTILHRPSPSISTSVALGLITKQSEYASIQAAERVDAITLSAASTSSSTLMTPASMEEMLDNLLNDFASEEDVDEEDPLGPCDVDMNADAGSYQPPLQTTDVGHEVDLIAIKESCRAAKAKARQTTGICSVGTAQEDASIYMNDIIVPSTEHQEPLPRSQGVLVQPIGDISGNTVVIAPASPTENVTDASHLRLWFKMIASPEVGLPITAMSGAKAASQLTIKRKPLDSLPSGMFQLCTGVDEGAQTQ